MTVNLTENCQLRCAMCTYWRSNKINLISAERAVRLIDEAVARRFKYLRFLGGEPLLRKDLFDILATVPEDVFSKIILCTNGMLLGKYCSEVNGSPITNLTVSIDGLGPTHDRIRGVPGCFDKVWANLDGICGKRIKIASIGSSLLSRDIDALLQLCADKGYDYDICALNTGLPFSAEGRSLAELRPSEADADRIVDALVRWGRVQGSLADSYRHYLLDNDRMMGTCVLGYVQVIIRADGALFMGCHDLDPVGNVVTSTLDTVLSSPAALETARKMFRQEFRKCNCSWQIDEAYRRPLRHRSYTRMRLRGRPYQRFKDG